MENQINYYHATYLPLLNSIKKKGLGGLNKKMWEFSLDNVVYLTTDFYEAVSFAETSEELENEDWLEQIIVLVIPAKNLLTDKLKVDKNNEGTFEYHDVIPFDKIERVILIAPNGNPSNLTPEQYKLVRTPQFKAWFGDWENSPESKVVDENGEPLVVYRGNLINQEELGYVFNLGKNFLRKENDNQFGFFFTNELGVAKKYMLVNHFDEIEGGSITSVFIKTNKILNLLDFGLKISQENFIDSLIEKGVHFDNEYNYLEKKIRDFDADSYKGWGYNVFDYFDVFPDLRNLFIKNGFNCVVFYEMSRMYNKYKVYVAFEPNQIKLADGSNTTFDSNNPDIRFNEGGEVLWNIKGAKDEFLKASQMFDKKEYWRKRYFPRLDKNILVKSNLNEDEWRLVNSENFIKWFGDWNIPSINSSKVINSLLYEDNDKGFYYSEPLIVYHASNTADYYEFDLDYKKTDSGFFGKGFYFGTSLSQVMGYGYIIRKYFINLRNPFYFQGSEREFAIKLNLSHLLEYDKEYDKYYLTNEFSEEVTKLLVSEKYDGLIIDSTFGSEIIAFYPEQIKLADGTNTTFDANNPDIRYNAGGEIKLSVSVANQNQSDDLYELLNESTELGSTGEARLVLLENDKVIGGIFLDKYALPYEYIFDIYIKKSKRRKGYSKLLLDAMIKDFIDNFPEADQIRSWVINKKLETYLEENYNFGCDDGNEEKIMYCYLLRRDAEKLKFESGGGINQYLIVVDIQPEYENYINNNNSSFMDDFVDYVNNTDKSVVFLYNGQDTLDMVYEYDYKNWLIDKGVLEEVVNSATFYDKGYAFFRYCMDEGINEDDIVGLVKMMYEKGINDSRELDDDFWIEYIENNGSENLKDMLNQSDDCIYIPDLMDFLKKYNGITICGGGINECLKEVEIALKALDKKYKVMGEYTYKKGGRTIAQTPAPKKDRVYGSKKNKPKSAESSSKASSIILNPKTISSIKSKIEIHNDKFPKKKIPLSTAKAVVRRGMGAYSSSHRPTIRGGKPNSRVAWGLARLNAFIYKIQKGYSKSGKYTQDDDLINELGYRVKKYESGGRTFNDKELLAKYKRGESIGFTGIAHLKAKGLIKRADGTIRKSDKYKYSEGGNLGKYAFADDRDDDIYYQKETIGKFARKIQGNKFEENTKKENQLIEKLIDWTNSSDAYNSNYFFNNKKIFEEGLKKHPEIFNPSLSDGDKFIYRGLQKLNNSLKKQLSLDLNDYVKLDLKQLSLFGVAGDSYYFMKKPINYEPERKAQSWTKDIKVASRFGLEGILVTHIDKNFFMNPDFMNVVRGAEKENEVIHIGKDFIKNNYLMISQLVYEDLSIKAKGKSYKDIISSVKYNVGGKINFQPSVEFDKKYGTSISKTDWQYPKNITTEQAYQIIQNSEKSIKDNYIYEIFMEDFIRMYRGSEFDIRKVNWSWVINGMISGFNSDDILYFITDWNKSITKQKAIQKKMTKELIDLGINERYLQWVISPKTFEKIKTQLKKSKNKSKHKEGGEIILTTEQVEDLLGRKLEIWNDSVVTINGQQYKKTFLKSEYRRL